MTQAREIHPVRCIRRCSWHALTFVGCGEPGGFVTGEYAAYLVSEAWQAKRAERLKLSNGRCSVPRCRKGKVIHCHHLTYERIFEEEMADLLPLCGDHHGTAEELIAAGKIDRRGDVEFLADETIRLIQENKKAEPVPKTKKSGFNSTAARLLSDPEFVKLLDLQRDNFKAAVRRKFGGKSHIMGNACALYDHCPLKTHRKKSKRKKTGRGGFGRPRLKWTPVTEAQRHAAACERYYELG